MDNIKKHLWTYIRKKSWFPILLLLCILWMFYHYSSTPFETLSVRQKRNAIKGWISTPLCLVLIVSRFILIIKILLDIVTGCKTKTIIAYVNHSTEDVSDLNHDKLDHRYSTAGIKDVTGKRYCVIQDKKLCNYRFVRGNIHTLQLLRFSNFLLDAKVGKPKNTGDGSLCS